MPQGKESEILDVGHVTRAIRERWLAAGLLAIAICAPIASWLLTRPPEYTASSTLRLESAADQVLNFKQVVDNSFDAQAVDPFVLTTAEEIESPGLHGEVVNSLTPEERRAALAAYPGAFIRPEDAQLDPDAAEKIRLQRLLTSIVTAERKGRTLLVSVNVIHRDPKMAAFLANRVAEQFVKRLIERAGSSSDSAVTFIAAQVKKAEADLNRAIKTLQDYREENNLVSLGAEQHLLVDRLKVLNNALAELRVRFLAVESRKAQAVEASDSEGNARSLSTMPEFTSYAATLARIDELRTQREVLAQRYGRRHPLMIENTSALQVLEEQKAANLAAALKNLDNQFQALKKEEGDLLTELAKTQADALKVDRLIANHDSLQRLMETARDTYTQLLARERETTVSKGLPNTNIKFVDRAIVPENPTRPARKKIALIVATLGAAIFFGFPLAIAPFDRRVKGWSDSEIEAEAPLLGEIGRIRKVRRAERCRIVFQDLDISTVEAFRCLHGQLIIRSKVAFPKTILVTSTIPSEGKTFVACNLAASFAAHGTRTLVVDCDFRRPSLHEAFGTDNRRGILTWIQSRQPLQDDVTKMVELGILRANENLAILRAGGATREATEILQSESIAQLFAALRQRYDLVIIDSPPAAVFPDADVLARVSEELLFVCRFKATQKPQVQNVIRRLQHTGISMTGVVLNALPLGSRGAGYSSSIGYVSDSKYAKYYDGKNG